MILISLIIYIYIYILLIFEDSVSMFVALKTAAAAAAASGKKTSMMSGFLRLDLSRIESYEHETGYEHIYIHYLILHSNSHVRSFMENV